jgi:hypothetical protein
MPGVLPGACRDRSAAGDRTLANIEERTRRRADGSRRQKPDLTGLCARQSISLSENLMTRPPELRVHLDIEQERVA